MGKSEIEAMKQIKPTPQVPTVGSSKLLMMANSSEGILSRSRTNDHRKETSDTGLSGEHQFTQAGQQKTLNIIVRDS